MTADLLTRLVSAIENREAVALVTVTHGTGDYEQSVGSHCLVWLDADTEPVGDLRLGELGDRVVGDSRRVIESREHSNLSYSTETGDLQLFVEVQSQPQHLVIVGAGHIAVPLAEVASLCAFQVTVLDDRPQFANAGRFPNAERVLAGPLRETLREIREDGSGLGADTYVVLVTRGHQHDIECLVEVLDDDLAYIGMIGSQRRIRAVFRLLEEEQGIASDKLSRVYAPIGLDIGARTPAEIAVCIMAEIINIMRHGPAVSLSEQIRRERIARRERVGAST